MAKPSSPIDFNNQNNLYPEQTKPLNPSQGSYKPLINGTPAPQPNNQQTQPEEFYRPIANNQSYQDNYNYQTQNRFDVQVNPTQTQRAFNKDIRQIRSTNKLQDILNWLSSKWWLALIIFLALAVVSLALWQILKPSDIRPGPFKNVQATILAPTASASGSPNTWKVEIKNTESVDLLNVELNLQFDSQFRYNRAITPSPSDPKGNKYSFSRIDAATKSGGTSTVIVEFEGIVTGRIDEQTYMQGTLTYTPEPLQNYNNNRESIKLDQVKTSISQPLVTATINPDNAEVEAGTETIIKINFENLSDKEITDLRLKMTYPDNSSFQYISSELLLSNSSSPRINPSDSNNIWDIATLPASGQQQLAIVGKVQGAENTQHSFSLDIQIKRADDTYQNIFSTSKDITITSRPLVVSTFIVNRNNGPIFDPGETLTFQINYKNQGQSILNNVQLVATINDPAEVLDFSTLEYQNNIVGNESNKTITWAGQSTPSLKSMSPGLEGNIQFNIRVKKQEQMINPSLNQGSYTLLPKVEAKADNIQPISAQSQIYKASGGVKLELVDVTYKASPTDASKRIYTVKWKVSTYQNNLKNVNISAVSTLPTTAWQPSSVKPTDLSYNPTNGQVSLHLDQLNSLYGINNSGYIIQYDLEVSQQVGGFKNIELYKDVTLSAVDDLTGVTYTQKITNYKTPA